MKAFRIALLASVATFAVPVYSWASITFKLADYSISALSADPGLVIQTSKLVDTSSTTYDFTLSLGGPEPVSHLVDLFDIWTDEESVNLLEDTVAKSISVDFSFSEPPPPFSGGPSGETDGVSGVFFFLGFIPIPYGAGTLEWDAPALLSFGPNDDGLLQVSLSNETFNGAIGPGTLAPGRENGATVSATFTLLAEPSGGIPGGEPGAVPEPAAAFVWSAFAALGALVALRKGRA